MSARQNLGRQFDYSVAHDADEGETHVFAQDSRSLDMVGAVSISRDLGPDAEQRMINRGLMKHHEMTHHSGTPGTANDPHQRYWTGGAFNRPYPSKLSWASLNKGTNPAVLRNMLGLAVHDAGKIPVADEDLTPDGSRFSRSMGLKYGIEAHPRNPDMAPTVPAIPERTGNKWAMEKLEYQDRLGNLEPVSDLDAHNAGLSIRPLRQPKPSHNGHQGVLFK